LFTLIRFGVATSRSEIARMTGLAPSTVSLRVNALIAAGLVDDIAPPNRSTGRSPRQLMLSEQSGLIALVDIELRFATIALSTLTGRILNTRTVEIDVNDGPAATVEGCWNAIVHLAELSKVDPASLIGIGVGVPAPVNALTQQVVLPSLLPGWHRADLKNLFGQHSAAAVLVENDANLEAIATHAETEADHILSISASGTVGSGIIVAGSLHRGAIGGAGEISHTKVTGEAAIACACGTDSCLESVASGRAITARLRSSGIDVSSVESVVELARVGDHAAVNSLRDAGVLLGEAVTPLVNFLNPQLVSLGGTLGASEPYVAAFRATIFQRALPLVTNDLLVESRETGPTSRIRGAVTLLAQTLLSVENVNHRTRSHEIASTVAGQVAP
jgi:predicted NBD/HSP70 family sugar kinase